MRQRKRYERRRPRAIPRPMERDPESGSVRRAEPRPSAEGSPPVPREETERERAFRREIVEVGLAICDREGVEALSMRRLAEELRCGTMTLYTYFVDKEAVLAALCDRVLEELELPRPEKNWRKPIRLLARSFRRTLFRHRSLIAAFVGKRQIGPAALRATNGSLAIFRRGGFSPEGAARAYALLFNYILGSVIVDATRGDDGNKERVRQAVGPDLSSYPHLVETGFSWVFADEETLFLEGLEILVEGIAATLPVTSG